MEQQERFRGVQIVVHRGLEAPAQQAIFAFALFAQELAHLPKLLNHLAGEVQICRKAFPGIAVMMVEERYANGIGIIFLEQIAESVRLPSDLLIFSPSCSTIPMCSQKREKGACPVKCSDCAISQVWCGKAKSAPPP